MRLKKRQLLASSIWIRKDTTADNYGNTCRFALYEDPKMLSEYAYSLAVETVSVAMAAGVSFDVAYSTLMKLASEAGPESAKPAWFWHWLCGGKALGWRFERVDNKFRLDKTGASLAVENPAGRFIARARRADFPVACVDGVLRGPIARSSPWGEIGDMPLYAYWRLIPDASTSASNPSAISNRWWPPPAV